MSVVRVSAMGAATLVIGFGAGISPATGVDDAPTVAASRAAALSPDARLARAYFVRMFNRVPTYKQGSICYQWKFQRASAVSRLASAVANDTGASVWSARVGVRRGFKRVCV